MCLAVFLASSSLLPPVPFIEGTSFLHVSELTEQEDEVRSHLASPNVVYVGAFTGCGCGFHPESEDLTGPYEERAERSLSELADYIGQHVNDETAEIYVSWENEWHLPPLRRLDLKLSELGGRVDWLEVRTHVALAS